MWRFDGLDVAHYEHRHHVMWEPYPTLVRAEGVPQSDLNDAHAATLWAQDHDRAGALRPALDLSGLDAAARQRVAFEGWIAGVDPAANGARC